MNCKKAYWCPAAPEPRSADTDSELVGQPSGPSIGPAGAELDATLDGVLRLGAAEDAVLLGRLELLAGELGTLAGALLTGTVLVSGAEGPAATGFDFGEQAEASSVTAHSSTSLELFAVIIQSP